MTPEEFETELRRIDYLAHLRVELPVNPEWEALTQGEREALLEGAHGNYIYENGSTSDLEKRGYIFDNSPEFGETVYHLTYKGAMIIPPHLVKKG